MGKHSDDIEFLERRKAQGFTTQLDERVELRSGDMFYWNAFAALYPNILFSEVLSYCNYVDERNVLETFSILRAMAGALKNGD